MNLTRAVLVAGLAAVACTSGTAARPAASSTGAEEGVVPGAAVEPAPTGAASEPAPERGSTVEADATATADVPVARPPGAPMTPGPTAVIDDWAELEARLHAIVRASLRTRARTDGQNELCARPRAVLWGSRPRSAEVCTPIAQILGSGPAWPALAAQDEGIVATTLVDGRDTIVGSIDVSVCGACSEPPREQILAQIRCGDLARFWSAVPRSDLRCAIDADCEVLSANCLAQPVARASAAPYRTVLARWGGPCSHPAAGACAPFRGRPVCESGVCATAP